MKHQIWKNLSDLVLLCIGVLLAQGMLAQKSIKCEVNSDTILMGNILEIQYSVENIDAKFDAPELLDLPIISGPNVSTQMSISNGKMSRYMTYSYRIKPLELGYISVPPAYFYAQDSTYEIPPFEISVLPNPEERLQRGRAMTTIYHYDLSTDTIALKPEKKLFNKKKRRL